MNEGNSHQEIVDRLSRIIEDTAIDQLLETLKLEALNIELNERDRFENALLAMAQKESNKGIRPVLYEIMVSLESIWTKNQPKMNLQNKFWDAVKEDSEENIVATYNEIARQGLDYLGEVNIGAGTLVPLTIGEEHFLLRYNQKEIYFHDLLLEKEVFQKIPVPEGLRIIDLLVVPSELSEIPHQNKMDGRIWILLEGKDKLKRIFSINIETIDSLKGDSHLIEQHTMDLDEEMSRITHLSFYLNHLLIISKNAVYYYTQPEGWREWYKISDYDITTFASTPHGFWLGHSDGTAIFLKRFDMIGIRDKFTEYKEKSEAIKSIQRVGKYVLIFSKNRLCVSNHAGNLIIPPINISGTIVGATVIDRQCVIIHHKNGILQARELRQGNIAWEINLAIVFQSLFTHRQYVYCSQQNGQNMVFKIPEWARMAKELEDHQIYVEIEPIELGPDAPVRYITDFKGRKDILKRIKEYGKAHFLLHGTPRIGKTSLLNILSDSLAGNSKCCIVDMAKLLKNVNSFAKFEEHFMEICLNQHSLSIDQLKRKDGYQSFRTMVTKIMGSKRFCVFCLDNFFIPDHFAEEDMKSFETFLRSMFLHPDVRAVMACNTKYKVKVVYLFDNFKDVFNQRQLIFEKIPLISKLVVKNAIRQKVSQNRDIVDKIYKNIGHFPHLLHLYDNWEKIEVPIDTYTGTIAKKFTSLIFDYFIDLSPDAYLLLATFFKYNKRLSGHINYSNFHENFPFLKSSLSREKHEAALMEINNYGGFLARSDKEAFEISPQSETQLFYKASIHIPWLSHFSTLYNFTVSPNVKKAHQVAELFTNITESQLDSGELLGRYMGRFKKLFYVNKLTPEGQRILDMPLSTFIIIPLQPWDTRSSKRAFEDLYVTVQEYIRVFSQMTQENAVHKFYILLFELHGSATERIKSDLIRLERISIIEASIMKNIIMDKFPRGKASEYIFDQLSIKERSPYTTAGAVPDELFFGREMEIALIRGLPENIGIFGTRTIGKTSLLRRLTKDLNPLKRWNVFTLDCSRIESEEALLKNLAEKMKIPFSTISDLEKFRKYIMVEAAGSDRQFLFLLDEIDRLVEYDLENDEKIFTTFNRLYTEPMERDDTAARFILFGFHKMFEQMKNPASRLYNFMVFMPLKPLDVDSALALVTRPMENIRVRWKSQDDARYLVDSCSCHPRLLQSACHSLLTILDSKKGDKDVIERSDVDQALTSAEFREICMRFYGNPKADIVERKKGFFASLSRKRSRDFAESQKGKKFLNDLHRITILSVIRLLFEEHMETFTINDIQEELKKSGIDVSPDVMRTILDHLCLSGNFNLIDETTILAEKEAEVKQKADKDLNLKKVNLSVSKPGTFQSDKLLLQFKYEFGVKMFPKLLVAQFGGLDQCRYELQKLIDKKEWINWIGRY